MFFYLFFCGSCSLFYYYRANNFFFVAMRRFSGNIRQVSVCYKNQLKWKCFFFWSKWSFLIPLDIISLNFHFIFCGGLEKNYSVVLKVHSVVKFGLPTHWMPLVCCGNLPHKSVDISNKFRNWIGRTSAVLSVIKKKYELFFNASMFSSKWRLNVILRWLYIVFEQVQI